MNLNIRKTIGLLSLLAVLIPNQCLGFLEEDEEIIKSFMPGKITSIAVVPGQQVKSGDLLYIFEVMKMYHHIFATRDGFIGSLYFTVDQHIEKDMPLITILPFMPVAKEGDPMDTDELLLPISQGNEPSLKDIFQNDLGEVVTSIIEAISNEGSFVIASEAKQSISEGENSSQPSHQISPSPWIAADSVSPRNDGGERDDVASLPSIITSVVKQSTSEVEDEPQTAQQEETLPLVVAPIIETFDNEGEGPDISSPTGINASEADPSISEYQPSQQEVTLPLVVAPIIEALNNEVEGDAVASLPSIIAIEEKPSISEHQPFQQVSTPSWIAAASMSPSNDEVEEVVVPPASVIASEAKQSISEYQPFQQEVTSPLIAVDSVSSRNDETVGDEIVSLPSIIAIEEKPSISEHQPFQQVSTPSWIAAASMSPRNDEVEEVVIPPASVIASEAKQSISEHQPLQQVSMPSSTDSVSPRNGEVTGDDVASSTVRVIASEAKPSISEIEDTSQPSQQLSMPSWIAVDSSHQTLIFSVSKKRAFNDDEAGVSPSLQKPKVKEFQQRVYNSKASTHLFWWLTRLLLLAFLSFCRSRPIKTYHIRNTFTPKTAENLNILGHLRDAA